MNYGRIVQTFGVLVGIIALAIFLWDHAPLSHTLAVAGSLSFAIGTKIVYFSRKPKK